MMSHGEVKPQSATMPRTLAGNSKQEAISTVVAPIDMPERYIGCSGPSRCAR